MRSWRKPSLILPLSAAIPLVLAWIFPRAITFILLTLWLAAVFMLLYRLENQRRIREVQETRQSMQTFVLEVLSHQRHDWMNELQLIYGYARMGKTERIEEIVTRVSEDMHKESRIAKLGLPELVFYLMTIKAEGRDIALRIQVDSELHYGGSLTAHEEEGLIRAIRAGMSAYRYSGLSAKAAAPALRIVFGEESGEATLFIEPENDPQAAPILHQAVEEALESYALKAESAEGGTFIRWKLPV
ncbi:hypothetical protein B9G55_21265 [Saccharibacillus sp. O16]|nr:hypothetical protein B9G55_21265 [Saccharibacillus sp. O16]